MQQLSEKAKERIKRLEDEEKEYFIKYGSRAKRGNDNMGRKSMREN